MVTLAIDIETVKNSNAEKYIEQFNRYEAPSNYKDKEKIEQYILNAKAKDLEQAGLHWWTGKIICIGCYDMLSNTEWFFYGDDEQKILVDFFTLLETNSYTNIIGKSSSDFDIPFIIGRTLRHNIGLPTILRRTNLDDVNKMFSFSKTSSQISSLANYAWGLEIEGKLGHGSQVQTMYNLAMLGDNKQWQDIANYCKRDVMIVVEMVNRYYKCFINQKGEPKCPLKMI
jgi:predicted PolB exonuclease-like 3'-5' exonuclease